MQDNTSYVTAAYLKELGITVGDTEIEALLEHLNDTIDERIGAEITEALDDEQLRELVTMQDAASEKELGDWIVKRVPDYKEIVQDNIDIAIGELAEGIDAINSTPATA